MAEATKDKKVRLTNTTRNVVVSGAIRIMPGQGIDIPESKIPEGLKRMIGAGLSKSE
jgi:hypothetical protein